MIDTDKYAGHTPGPWKWPKKDSILLKGPGRNKYIITERHRRLSYSIDKKADAQLIADAPLLLEEVKRLRKAIKKWEDEWCKLGDYISHYDYKMYEAIDEDIGWAE